MLLDNAFRKASCLDTRSVHSSNHVVQGGGTAKAMLTNPIGDSFDSLLLVPTTSVSELLAKGFVEQLENSMGVRYHWLDRVPIQARCTALLDALPDGRQKDALSNQFQKAFGKHAEVVDEAKAFTF